MTCLPLQLLLPPYFSWSQRDTGVLTCHEEVMSSFSRRASSCPQWGLSGAWSLPPSGSPQSGGAGQVLIKSLGPLAWGNLPFLLLPFLLHHLTEAPSFSLWTPCSLHTVSSHLVLFFFFLPITWPFGSLPAALPHAFFILPSLISQGLPCDPW